jgi:nucleotide sugar dehydrogenase
VTAGPRTAATATTWDGTPGTTGRAVVVGAGKIGLPLAAQYASAGWSVVAVDIDPRVVEAINAGRSHVAEETGLAELVSEVHAAGRLRATTDTAGAVADADVVVVIVPVMLSDEAADGHVAGASPEGSSTASPTASADYRFIDAAAESVAGGLRAPAVRGGPTLVIFETTLPVGDTRGRLGAALSAGSGLPAGDPQAGFLLAFSPERVFSGRVFRDLATYPKLVGGIDPISTERAAAFYRSVLPADVWALASSESAEFAKLAETTYRDVNIALANEFARYADAVGVDVQEVIAAANSQPFSHIHQPGIGVGGHCIPVYPHFLISRSALDFAIPALARRINDEQVERAIETLEQALGGLAGVPVLVLGLTYRDGVAELAYSRAVPLIEGLRTRGAEVWAHDPLLDAVQVERLGARPWRWGENGPFRAVVAQTADPRFRELDPTWFPEMRVLYDGRNGLRALALPAGARYVGVGVQDGNRIPRQPTTGPSA